MSDQRWLITGASGQLGGHLLAVLAARGAPLLALVGRGPLGIPGVAALRIDLRDATALRECVAKFRPTHVIHAGAMTAVADACARPAEAAQVNTQATVVLAEATEQCGGRLVFCSTDMVFDGTAAPYREDDLPCPLSQYGRTKATAERYLSGMRHVLIVRIPLLYGFACTARETTFARQVAALRAGTPLRLFTDEFRTPVSLPDAARALVGLACSARTGVLHLAGPQRLSRYELIAQVADALGLAHARLEGGARDSVPAPEPRPADLSLDDRLFRAAFPGLAPGPVSRAALNAPGRET